MDNALEPAVPRILNQLLTQEAGSLLQAVESFGLYLPPSAAGFHKILAGMAQDIHLHAANLANLLEHLNIPITATAINPDAGSLAYLSLKFFLPKLIAEKNRFIAMYQVSLGQLSAGAPPAVTALLNAHLERHTQHLAMLIHAAGE